MYKVFINEKAIFLTDKYEDYRSEYDTLYIRYGSKQGLMESIELLSDSDVVNSLVVYAENLEQLWNDFTESFPNITAAGGVVSKDDKVLLIYKNGHWDLPKGKIDKGESSEETALREVTEECGLDGLSITGNLNPTYYIFKDNGNQILKKTDWFSMSATEDGPLQGDAKEGITDVRWMSKDDWSKEKGKSYPSVVNMLQSVFN